MPVYVLTPTLAHYNLAVSWICQDGELDVLLFASLHIRQTEDDLPVTRELNGRNNRLVGLIRLIDIVVGNVIILLSHHEQACLLFRL